MSHPQHNTRCPVYLHPAACSNPAAVAAIQQRTGLLVITNFNSRPQAVQINRTPSIDEFGPFGGDAA